VTDGRIHYARNGDIRLAYRVYGDDDATLVWVPVALSRIDHYDDPSHPWGAMVHALHREMRVVVFDGRGMGLSDPVARAPSLTQRVDDLLAVLDAAGAPRSTLFAGFAGGPVSILFAATHPDRVRSLVLYSTASRFTYHLPDHPWGFTQAQVDSQLADIDANWGQGALAEFFMGGAAEVPGVREQWGRFQSSVGSPAMARLLWQTYMQDDVRDVLAAVHAPALVMARPGDRVVPLEASAALAAGLPNAQMLTLPPGDHVGFDVNDLVVSEILKFCEKPSAARAERVLTTVMFTDIVGSTEQLTATGDEHWRHRLDVHDQVVDTVLSEHGGRRILHTGDGVFAMFDGPPSTAVRCGLELVSGLATQGIRIRVGIHVGECEKRGDNWSGLAIHVGARIGAMAGPGEILTSRTVRDVCAGSGLAFEDRGVHRLKGLPDDTDVFRVRTPTGAGF
jgi:class 3 adenylate cyclase